MFYQVWEVNMPKLTCGSCFGKLNQYHFQNHICIYSCMLLRLNSKCEEEKTTKIFGDMSGPFQHKEAAS